jgi:hypothetical protein
MDSIDPCGDDDDAAGAQAPEVMRSTLREHRGGQAPASKYTGMRRAGQDAAGNDTVSARMVVPPVHGPA